MRRKLLSILALLCMTVASAWADSFSTEPYSSDVTLSGVTVSSDMTITINSGVTVTVNNGLSISSGKTLTVVGDGTLRVNGAGGSTAVSGNIIVQGATVRASGGNGSNGSNGTSYGNTGYSHPDGGNGGQGGQGGAAFSGAVVIYSGQIVAQGGTGGRGGNGGNGGSTENVAANYGGNGGNGGRGGNGGTAFTGTLTVYGGNVDAIGGNAGSGGSGGSGGTSYRNRGANGYAGSAGNAGSAFSNASNLIRKNSANTKMYSDANKTTQIYSVSGRTIYITAPNAVPSLTLSEATDNSVALADNDGRLVLNITLTRTLQTGGWNTFSVPFSIAKPSGWTVKELTGASFEDATNTLSLTFGDAESIVAGHAYLVQVESAVENPTFNDVTIVNGTTATTIEGVVEFVPAINPTALTTGDKSCLFVSGGNTLTWASSGSNMYGFRAYFHILDGSIANARAFSMDFGDDDVTGIIDVTDDEGVTDGAFYTLDGRKLDGQPTQKGVYVVNGKKVIIK